MKLQCDHPYDKFVEQLESTLQSIAARYLEETGVDLYANLPPSEEVLILDDEFGPFLASDEIGGVFLAATRHIDFAERASTEGAHELAWARVAFASRMVGRIHLIDSVESRVERDKHIDLAPVIRTP